MEKLKTKLETFEQALKTLKESIESIEEEFPASAHTSKTYIVYRDSLIQCFEYCTDLVWKVLKIYLEDFEKTSLDTSAPRGIVRATVNIKLLSEDEGAQYMQMITNRNMTSHMYHQEVAENIARQVPSFYALMAATVERLKKNIEQK